MATATYETSKTFQYRKVKKPILERQRRARINKCLDELKDLISECMQQQSGDSNIKLEKADILELTVQHLRKERNNNPLPQTNGRESFRTGYIQAAKEISHCLAKLPEVDIGLGTRLMTQLGYRLNELMAQTPAPLPTIPMFPNVIYPLNICCDLEVSHQHRTPSMASPSSSGYGSDSDCQCTSSTGCGMLLQIAAQPNDENTFWRPW